jgi:hypothetical protein
MKLLVMLTLYFTISFILRASETEIDLTQLDKGKSNAYSWALYKSPSKSGNLDLVLIIRNTGAKWIDLEGVTKANFECKLITGQQAKLLSISNTKGIGYEKLLVTHLNIDGEQLKGATYTIEMKPNPKAFVPVGFKTNPIINTP